ncbi:hypothetical protein pb186bvf_018743 [Paramecium bursaria]
MKRKIYQKDFKEFSNKMFGGIDGVTDLLTTIDNHRKLCEDTSQSMDEYADCILILSQMIPGIENKDQMISRQNQLFQYRRRFHNSTILECFKQYSDTRDYDACKKEGIEKSEQIMKEYIQNIS